MKHIKKMFDAFCDTQVVIAGIRPGQLVIPVIFNLAINDLIWRKTTQAKKYPLDVYRAGIILFLHNAVNPRYACIASWRLT